MNNQSTDKGSLIALRLAYYAEVVAALTDFFWRGYARQWFFPVSYTEFARVICGLAVMIAGVVLRVAAGRALGPWWSLRAQIKEGQTLVTTGPYRWARHPSYLAMLLVCVGIPIAFGSIWAAVVMAVGIWPALIHRVAVEERLLTAHFGDEYRAYAQRTARLIPRVF